MKYRNKPNSVKKPWGGYEVLEKSPRFWIKKLYVNKGTRLSLQSHKYRSETWLVLSGKILARKGRAEKILCAGGAITIEKMKNIELLVLRPLRCLR